MLMILDPSVDLASYPLIESFPLLFFLIARISILVTGWDKYFLVCFVVFSKAKGDPFRSLNESPALQSLDREIFRREWLIIEGRAGFRSALVQIFIYPESKLAIG